MAGLEVAESGILICKDFNGRPSGEAYVQLNTSIDAEKALEKNNANMGHRWGHITLTNLAGWDTRWGVTRGSTPRGGVTGGHWAQSASV